MKSDINVKTFHDKAMDLADQADRLKRMKVFDKNDVITFQQEAFQFEKKAAMILEKEKNCEPTRSVLFRSAGWLAYNSGLKEDAIKMVNLGLQYCVHEEIKQELLELKNLLI